jgi:4'-phosphopantetheinyl transferase EntD
MPLNPSSLRGVSAWPVGCVGSLAHDACFAVAAAASSNHFLAIGIDVEPAEPLPPDLIDAAATPREQSWYAKEVLQSRVLFAVKEATYKAVNPFDGTFLDFHDVIVDLRAKKAFIDHWTSGRFCCHRRVPRIVALAYLRLP